MNIIEIKELAEIAKNSSEAVKNFASAIDNFFQPRGLDRILLEGHEKLISSCIQNENIDIEVKRIFLSTYKQRVKEDRNCNNVVYSASPMISEDARPQDIKEDWFAFFFDKVRLVSDESFQQVWAKVLANEANSPGTYPRSLIHTLSIMENLQANWFCNISRFCLHEYKNEGEIHLLLFFATNVESYRESEIYEHQLIELANLGLIQYDFDKEYVYQKKQVLSYGNKVIEIYGDPDNNYKIKAGNVKFTPNGKILYSIVENSFKAYRADILDFIITKFRRRNCKVVINGSEVK